MNPRSIHSLLHLIANLKPEALDSVIPHGIKVSSASRAYLLAMAMKGFQSEVGETIDLTALSSGQQPASKPIA